MGMYVNEGTASASASASAMVSATVVVATNNANKAREIRALLDGAGCAALKVLALAEAGICADPEETGDTFEENALIKARAAYGALRRAAERGECANPAVGGAMRAGLLFVLADDSGLRVDCLGGAPGVRSARYAGEGADDAARVAKLLREMEGVPRPQRGAHFACAAALICPDGSERVCEGRCDGEILCAPAGQGGFGYDPVFSVDGLGQTMAELSFDEKNRVSHRGKAARAAARMIAGWMAGQ